MSNLINFYKPSEIGWKPIELNLVGESYPLKTAPVVFSNGLKFNLYECLSECKDYQANNKTALFLTDLTKQTNFLNPNKNYGETQPLTEIVSPMATLDNKIIENNKIETEPWNRLLLTDRENYTKEDNFIFKFYSDYVTIESQKDNQFLTWLAGVGQGNIIIYPKIFPIIDNQKFKYFLGDDTIILFKYDTFFNDIVMNDIGFNVKFYVNQYYGTQAYGLSSLPAFYQDTMPKNSIIKLISYKKRFSLESDLKNSFLGKYDTNPLSQKNNLVLNEDYKKIPYSQNYLGIIPYEYPTETTKTIKYPLHVHGLKNYQTPEYNYATYRKNSELEENNLGTRRFYNKIFSGTNQINGLEQVYLSYTSNSVEIKFPSDGDTPFYFASTDKRVKIEESNLTEDGALAGHVPYVSDRLFFKLEDYSEVMPNLPVPPSIKGGGKNIANNTWLCSWLSLSSNGKSVWLDRYYNSAFYTVNEALTSKVYKYEQKIDSDEPYVFDVPSNMFLEVGGLYRFYHVGRKTREKYLDYIDTIDNDPHLPLGGKLLHVKNWNSDPLKDSSLYENDGILYFNKLENLKDTYFELDGTNHALFPAKNILLEQNKLSVALWIDVEDWNDVNGGQVFGNYFDSGFGLINESSLTTPIITLVNKNTNKFHNINYRFGNINNFPISESIENSENKIIIRLYDFSFWIFDTKQKTAKKFSIDEQLLYSITIPYLNNISQVEVDSKENLYIYDNISKRCIICNFKGEYINDVVLGENIQRIEIDLNDQLISIYGEQSIIDNKNAIWQVLGSNLYRGLDPLKLDQSQIFANIGYVQDIACDAYNNLWISHEQDYLTKINTNEEKIEFTVRIGRSASLPQNPCLISERQRFRYLNLIRVPIDSNSTICNGNSQKTEDRVLLIDTNEKTLYQLDIFGNLLTKLDLNGLFQDPNGVVFCEGDITGYQNIRKYKSVYKKFSWKVKAADINKGNQQLYSLSYNLSSLSKGWHHFAFVFDAIEGHVTSYLDSVPIETINFEPKKYQLSYDYRTSLLLGIQSIKNTNLNDIIEIDDGYKFIGRVADLRLYGKSLNKNVIEQIFYSSKLGTTDKEMVWNMPVGKRSFVEDIRNWYKMQIPGSKSKYFNIKIHNLNVSDDVKLVIEDAIKNNLYKIAPAQASLYKIEWS
jgi:hypothetical protein